MSTSADVRLAVLGRAGVGKSAVVVRFLTNRFIWEYDPTLEATYKHEVVVDEETISMDIFDTAGQDESGSWSVWADALLLVYDVTERGSLTYASHIKTLAARPVPVVLLGNKIDLEHARQVSFEEGEQAAMELGAGFFECSACTSEGGLSEAFLELARETRRIRAAQSRPRRRSSTTHVRQAFSKMLTKIGS
uniref:ras-related and estrogen-regulated growth inhibitor n=1 Tax=Myxine glutinosa TaxID=7769 RepID=UPI00358EF8A1